MDPITLILLVVALVLLGVALWRGRDVALAGLRAGGQTLWRNLALLLLGFVIAGLAQVLIPKELVTRWLGAESGTRGILIACVVGGIVPGAPYATFPLVASLYRAGASIGAVVGFVTAWALWSVSRCGSSGDDMSTCEVTARDGMASPFPSTWPGTPLRPTPTCTAFIGKPGCRYSYRTRDRQKGK